MVKEANNHVFAALPTYADFKLYRNAFVFLKRRDCKEGETDHREQLKVLLAKSYQDAPLPVPMDDINFTCTQLHSVSTTVVNRRKQLGEASHTLEDAWEALRRERVNGVSVSNRYVQRRSSTALVAVMKSCDTGHYNDARPQSYQQSQINSHLLTGVEDTFPLFDIEHLVVRVSDTKDMQELARHERDHHTIDVVNASVTTHNDVVELDEPGEHTKKRKRSESLTHDEDELLALLPDKEHSSTSSALKTAFVANPRSKGFGLEEIIHDMLQLLEGVTALREKDIKYTYGASVSGIDHIFEYEGRRLYLQDKWEASRPKVERIGQLSSDVQIVERKNPSSLYKVAWISAQTGSKNAQQAFKECNIVPIHDDDMEVIVWKTYELAQHFLQYPSKYPEHVVKTLISLQVYSLDLPNRPSVRTMLSQLGNSLGKFGRVGSAKKSMKATQ